jgi:hypothetical protein
MLADVSLVDQLISSQISSVNRKDNAIADQLIQSLRELTSTHLDSTRSGVGEEEELLVGLY